MKHFFLLMSFLAGMFLSPVKAQSVLTPDPAKNYYLIQTAGNFLSESGTSVKLDMPGSSSNHLFKFAPVDGAAGVYTIQVQSTSAYVTKSGTWDVVLGTDATVNAAKFLIEDCGNGYVRFKCQDNNLYLGTDVAESGSLLYSDKGGSDPKHQWVIREAVENELIKSSLNLAISNAQALKDTSVVGTEISQYPEAAMLTFASALDAAKSVYSTATLQADINAATTALNQAVATFKAAKNKPLFSPDPAKTYYIVHSSGYFMTESGTTININAPTGASAQYFKFVPVPDSTRLYAIKVLSSSKYITKSGTYNVTMGTDSLTNLAWFRGEVIDGTLSTYRFKCLQNSKYLGTDANTAAAGVYSDKGGTDGKHYWTLREVIPGELFKETLSASITAAEKLLAKAVKGDAPGQYPEAVYNAFSTAIASARNVLETATVQTDINVAYTSLTTAQTAFTTGRIKPVFVPESGVKYRVMNKMYTKYITINGDNNQTATGWSVAFTSGLANQQWEFQAVSGLSGVYQMINNGQALTYTAASGSYAITMAAPDAANTNQQFKFVYFGTENDRDLFVLTTPDEKFDLCISSGTRARMITKNFTDAGHRSLISKVDMPNDPNKETLADYLYTARTTLESKIIGTAIGTWPQSAYDDFNAVIATSAAMVSGSGSTQAQVDAQLTALKAAETSYNNSKIGSSVTKTALKAALETATAKLNAAVVGEQAGQYLMSVIETFRTNLAASAQVYSTSVKQADIDAETTSVQSKTTAFDAAANTSAIAVSAVIADVVPFAQSLHDKATIGTEKGQYLQTVVDAYQGAINLARNNASPVRADLDALLLAMNSFKNAAVTIDRKALKTTIDAAAQLSGTVVPGLFNGQYPQSKLTALNAALASANQIYNLSEVTQAKIDSVNTVLSAALTALNASKIVISFTALSTAVTNANAATTAASIGTLPEQYTQDVFDALKNKATAAQAYINNNQVSQAQVDSVATGLAAALTLFKNSVNPRIFTTLKAIIDQAQSTLDAAVTGNYHGAYSQSTKNSFATSIANARQVYENAASTQADIDAATTKLTSLLSNFKLLYVKVSKVNLKAVIDEMKAFSDTAVVAHYTAESYRKFKAQIDSSLAVYNNAYASQTMVDNSQSLLTASMFDLEVVTAVAQPRDEPMQVYTQGNELRIVKMERGTSVSIWSISGKQVCAVVHAGEAWSHNLPDGVYLVRCSNSKGAKTIRVVVR